MRTPSHASLLAAAALVFAAPWAHAQDQPLTRADVRAEVLRAQSSGELQRLQTDYAPGNWSALSQGSAARGADAGPRGRAFDAPAPTARMPAPVMVPVGDEGE